MKRFTFSVGLTLSLLAVSAEPVLAQGFSIINPEEVNRVGLNDIPKILMTIIQLALAFAAGVGALFIVIAGYQYVLAAGNPEKLEKAKMGLTWSIGGFILAMSAYAIVLLLQKTLRARETVEGIQGRIGGEIGTPPAEPASIIENLAYLLLGFGAATAILFLVLGGYRYVTSQGNQDLAEKAKKTIMYSMIGLLLMFAAVVIIQLVTGKLNVDNSLL